ncbi:SWIM zinc finger family protein [Streptomyces sioyaensis]|uniref:SWIM zinc finger family protein n=1 Tax=Streptomyces sioyaensis TaxID=67364 RepID=A0A4Q1R3I3_9ACTN|nr:SWIM zinc finger family protein [Streptomyces sioyaensis]MBM4794006.1 SWIM zinc finger family protein [Streptomyces sioyaensis]RXS65943.1 SWIM zinc finger family protein [Streptomyces sioyaensis]
MNPQGERWTTDQVLALAPGEASRKAGGKLAAPEPWSETGADEAALWGQCKGSGKQPYRTVVDLNGPAFTCSCPSRKFPCKHALGLLLLWAGGGDRAVAAGEPASWAVEWLAGRRERAGRPAGAAPGGGAGSRAPAAPEAAERRAARRMQRIGAGAVELEQRLEDLLHSGLASAGRAGGGDSPPGGSGSAGGSWDETAARMVDAQAPGLAARVRELGSVVASGADWPARLLEECALLHLLDQAFLGLDRLPTPLAATVRSRVGLTTEAAELLTGPDAATVRDRWLVLAQQDSDDGKLLTRRIFLRGERTGRMALHLSFGGPHRPLDLALPPGLVLDADLAYYPGARPLRAALGERHAPAAPGPVPPGCGIDAALTAYGDALRDDPWLDSWPVVLTDVTPIPGRDGAGWQLADADGESALPLDPRCSGRASRWQLAAISGGAPVTVFGECGHRGFLPLTVWDPTPVSL